MRKTPNSMYVLVALALLAGSLFSGCADTSSTSTPNTDYSTVSTQNTDTDTNTSENSEDLESTNPSDDAVTTSPAPTTPTPATTTPDTSTSPTPATTTPDTGTTKPSVYSESSAYQSPAGTEDVTFNFTLEKDVVSNIELKATPLSPISERFQGLFMTGIKKEIVGKKLKDIGTFTVVNGSSLTSSAFNKAVDQLKTQVKAS